MQAGDGLYLAMFSVHGLIRGTDLELGRDADTGGQVTYVVELARALAANKAVAQVDLFTRRVEDPKVDESYAREVEPIAPGARIVRLRCGPRRYLRKEALWPHLDGLVDEALRHFRKAGRLPDILHGHYADGGLVAAKLSAVLGVPMVFTGHSLGMEKRRRMLDRGMKAESIEKRFHIANRIEAEELALGSASVVIGSTRQEVEDQYAKYTHFHPDRTHVEPPGVDLTRFSAPLESGTMAAPMQAELNRFLRTPNKPLILAISRADARKNIPTLIRAYGECPRLREAANLALVIGTREDLESMDREARDVMTEVLVAIDRYDLYGSVAYPKRHGSDDVPDLYRIAARRRGVFVNPALTEPFGLTLIEAAACGLPVVATNDGGPRDIIKHCNNGVLIDPLDPDDLARGLRDVLFDRDAWKKRAANGKRSVRERYSWTAHAKHFLAVLRRDVIGAPRDKKPGSRQRFERNRLATAEISLITDIDNTLIGDRKATAELVRLLKRERDRMGFGVATGRTLESALDVLGEWQVPTPDVVIAGVGAEIAYGPNLIRDTSWSEHIAYRWSPEGIREALADVPGLDLQPVSEQLVHKISYHVVADADFEVPEIRAILRERGLHANCIYSHGRYLDVLPIRASKGLAVRYLSMRWGLDADQLIVAGDSGNDFEMLAGETLAIVVANHSEELRGLRGRERVYFSPSSYANGILDGLGHYRQGPVPPRASLLEGSH